jgi:hypothetical protein
MALADTVRTTLGPRGMDKLIHDDKVSGGRWWWLVVIVVVVLSGGAAWRVKVVARERARA